MNKKAYIIFFVCRHRWYTRTYTQYRLDRHTHTHTYRLAKKPELLGQQRERHVSFSFFSPTHAQHSHLSDVHFDGLYIHIIRVFWAWSTSIASLKWWLTASFECECVRRTLYVVSLSATGSFYTIFNSVLNAFYVSWTLWTIQSGDNARAAHRERNRHATSTLLWHGN